MQYKIKELIESNGGIISYSKKFKIPYRTVQNWKEGVRNPPDWLVNHLGQLDYVWNLLKNMEKALKNKDYQKGGKYNGLANMSFWKAEEELKDFLRK